MDESNAVKYVHYVGLNTDIIYLGECSKESSQQRGSGISGTGVQFINYCITCEAQLSVFTTCDEQNLELLYEKSLPVSHRFVSMDYTDTTTPWANTLQAIAKVIRSWPIPDEYRVPMINRIINESWGIAQAVSSGNNVLDIHVKNSILIEDTYKITKRAMTTEEKDDVCPICLDRLITSTSTGSGDDDGIEFLDCSHGFHEDCISKWLQKGTNCPVCRCKATTVIDNILLWTKHDVHRLTDALQ